jgi:hypothetical protein
MPGQFFYSGICNSRIISLEMLNGMKNGFTHLGKSGLKIWTWRNEGTRMKKRAMINELMEIRNLPQSWK